MHTIYIHIYKTYKTLVLLRVVNFGTIYRFKPVDCIVIRKVSSLWVRHIISVLVKTSKKQACFN